MMKFKIILLFNTVLFTNCESVSNTFKLRKSNTLFIHDVMDTYESGSPSNIFCALLCVRSKCLSYTYRDQDFYCRLYHSALPSSIGEIPYEGAIFYSLYKTFLNVSNGERWGQWGQPVFCPAGTFAIGYQIQFELPQGYDDDSALNNLCLVCSNDNSSSEKIVYGEVNNTAIGSWLPTIYCTTSGYYLTSFKMRVESGMTTSDDTAVNAVQFKCRALDGSVSVSLPLQDNYERGRWGEWGEWSDECPPKSAICGIQVKYEPRLPGDTDYTGINDVKFVCC